ncbi:hypothetical protein CJ030_MR7G017744 [Morella rubra]|uniref:Uncharacterized protein n=1 Tax=Morella rubra TaxID=262757 RepID=A0A6A1V4R8_9ROSI|nr:hypothetical protein CJ030_MR7G017744 [Morella rubra]
MKNTMKPSFPAKKRVQVPQNPFPETQARLAGFEDELCEIAKEEPRRSSTILFHSLCFAAFLDSEMFEWTQGPCSPELCSSPFKMQVADMKDINGIQVNELEAALQAVITNEEPSTENKSLSKSKIVTMVTKWIRLANSVEDSEPEQTWKGNYTNPRELVYPKTIKNKRIPLQPVYVSTNADKTIDRKLEANSNVGASIYENQNPQPAN